MKLEHIAIIFSILVAIVNLLLTNVSNFMGRRIAETRAEVTMEKRIDALEKEIVQLKAEIVYLERKALQGLQKLRSDAE